MSLDEVKAFFMQEVPVVAGGDVKLEGWTAALANVHGGPSSSKSKLATSASLADHSNPMWIANQHGFGWARWLCKRMLANMVSMASTL